MLPVPENRGGQAQALARKMVSVFRQIIVLIVALIFENQ